VKTIIKCVLLMVFIGVLVCLFSNNASAADCTWVGGPPSTSHTAALWANGTAPTTGDNVYFTTGSAACTWDTTETIAYMSIGAGYSGTITQSSIVNIGARGFYQNGGTLTASVSYMFNCGGPFTKAGGTLTNYLLTLVMTVDGNTITGSVAYYLLQISGSTYYNQNGGSVVGLIIDTNKVLTINSGKSVSSLTYNAAYLFTNNGRIDGPGTFNFMFALASKTIIFGDIRSALSIINDNTATNFILTMGGSSSNIGILTVRSTHATNTMTLALAGYSLGTASTVIGVRGVLSGSGSISCSTSFDSYNGTTSGAWSLTMTGTNPWIKTPAANTINGLTWTGTNLRLASSLNVTKTFWVGGTYTLGTKTLTVGTGTNVTVTLGNSWTVPATRYWGRLNVAGTLTAASPVSVWANGTSYINGTVNSNIVLHTRAMNSFNGAVGDLYLETGSAVRFYANGTWSNIYWNTTTTWYFHPETLMPFTSPVYSKAQMRVIDPTNNAYYIEVTRFDTNAGFYITVHGWAAETWEFVVTSTYATATLFTYNIVTPDVETEPVLIYLNGVYLDSKNMTLGSFTMNDVFNASAGSRDYLIVCSDFGPTTATTTFDYGVMGMCLVILSILTFASFRFQPLFIINGFAWIVVAMLIIQPVQNTMALLCLGVGLIFAMWGAYRALLN
jgi:hypothetical protein